MPRNIYFYAVVIQAVITATAVAASTIWCLCKQPISVSVKKHWQDLLTGTRSWEFDIECLLCIRRYSNGAVYRGQGRIDGKVVIVTGANTGIGKEAALDLVNRGHIISSRQCYFCLFSNVIKASDNIRMVLLVYCFQAVLAYILCSCMHLWNTEHIQKGKSSESVQCAMLKACDACADMGQL